MVTVKLIGGMGNQMFQYALARHLSLKNNSELVLDLSDLLDRVSFDHTPRDFGLDVFNIQYSNLIYPGDKSSLSNKLNITKRIRDKYLTQYINEKEPMFDPSVPELKGNVYLNGIWQSENYFKPSSSIIRKDFTFKTVPDQKTKTLMDKITSVNSVSIQFRRGDYITNESAKEYHGVMSFDYYQQAIDTISESVDAPHFFIFSDDIGWVKDNFKITHSHHFVSDNKDLPISTDMHLMSLCKHNIIANSSFGWWGAWLNSNPDKIVVGPKKWFNSVPTDTIPKEWIKL